jgi:hypothetical protein
MKYCGVPHILVIAQTTLFEIIRQEARAKRLLKKVFLSLLVSSFLC